MNISGIVSDDPSTPSASPPPPRRACRPQGADRVSGLLPRHCPCPLARLPSAALGSGASEMERPLMTAVTRRSGPEVAIADVVTFIPNGPARRHGGRSGPGVAGYAQNYRNELIGCGTQAAAPGRPAPPMTCRCQRRRRAPSAPAVPRRPRDGRSRYRDRQAVEGVTAPPIGSRLDIPRRPTAWLGISDSNFDVQREYPGRRRQRRGP
jgi:hypothetical protein